MPRIKISKKISNKNQSTGFILTPVLILMLVSLMIIITGSKELHQTVLMHKLQLYKSCISLTEEFEPALDKGHCPACPLPLACN